MTNSKSIPSLSTYTVWAVAQNISVKKSGKRLPKKEKGYTPKQSSQYFESQYSLANDITRSAKTLRSLQNRRAYEKRTEKAHTVTPSWPKIPRALRQQAAIPLPLTSHWFRLEARSQEEASEDDRLAVWEYHPPYRVAHGSIGGGGLEAVSDGVHGRRYRIQQQFEAKRLRRFDKMTDDEMLIEISDHIKANLAEWARLQELNKTLSSHIDQVMGNHLGQWKARLVIDLLEDWRAVKKGRKNDAFYVLFANRW
jgi:hypothetical protein